MIYWRRGVSGVVCKGCGHYCMWGEQVVDHVAVFPESEFWRIVINVLHNDADLLGGVKWRATSVRGSHVEQEVEVSGVAIYPSCGPDISVVVNTERNWKHIEICVKISTE